MGTIKTYDPKQVVVSFGGVPLTGFADGTFVKVSRGSDMWKTYIGADGSGSRSKSNDKSGTIEITLAATSPSNAVLAAAQKLDEVSNAGVAPAIVKDNSGLSIYMAANAWVQKPADGEFAKDITDRTWILASESIEMFNGGNTTT